MPAITYKITFTEYIWAKFVNFDTKNNNTLNYQRPISGHQPTRFGTHHQFKVLSG